MASATIGLSTGACVLILVSGIPIEYHLLLWTPYLALSSSMACRIFRAVLLGTIRDPQISTSEMVFIFKNTPAYSFSITDDRRSNDPSIPHENNGVNGVIDIKETVKALSMADVNVEMDISSCSQRSWV